MNRTKNNGIRLGKNKLHAFNFQLAHSNAVQNETDTNNRSITYRSYDLAKQIEKKKKRKRQQR